MPDWAIVLVAAFGGGLAGAVLQPVVSYFLQRIHSGEEIRKRRERSLRRMLDVEIMDGRAYLGLLGLISARISMGAPLTSLEIMEKLKEIVEQRAAGSALWQPGRIADANLHSTVNEYHKALMNLHFLFSSPQYDEQKASQLANRLEELQPRITQRMDELNWPEADD